MATHNVGLSNSQVDNYLRANYPMRTNDSLDSSQLVFVTSSGLPKRIPYGDFVEILSGSIQIQREGVSPAYSQTVPNGAKSVIINSVGGKSAVSGGALYSARLTSIESLDSDGNLLGSITLHDDLREALGYIRSANGHTYDEYDFRHKKYVQRVTRKAIGELDFTWNSTGQYFEATISNKAPGWNNILLFTPNDVYSLPVSNASSDFVDKTVKGFLTNTKIAIKDSRYATAEELKAATQSYSIYYGLAFPTEVDISPYFPENSILPVEAGGTIVFKQAYSATMPLPNGIVFSSLPAPD